MQTGKLAGKIMQAGWLKRVALRQAGWLDKQAVRYSCGEAVSSGWLERQEDWAVASLDGKVGC
jgi:hypothetical protein